MRHLNAFSLSLTTSHHAIDAPIKGTSLPHFLYISPISNYRTVFSRELLCHSSARAFFHSTLQLPQVATDSEMAQTRLAFVALALACLAASATAREFGQEKTYAPPYGSGSSPAVPDTPPYSPTPSGDSPIVPTPVVPTPVVPTPDVPYTPTPYTPADPAPTSSMPGTCSWWSSNTSSFPDIISLITTLTDIFGSISGGSGGMGGSGGSSIISSIFGNQMTVFQGLTNTRTDGYGALARQSSAAILNAYSRPREFAYSPLQVKQQFRNALASQQSAFQMASVFENANNALGARH